MTLDEYQAEAARTAGTGRGVLELPYLGLGIAGEAGEVADEIKKIIGHGHALDREKLKKEIGDVLWYVAVLSRHLGLTLEEVAVANIAKLAVRYPDWFTPERSQNREP